MPRFLLPLLTASALALAACSQSVGMTDNSATTIGNAQPALQGGDLAGTRWRLVTYGPASAPLHALDNPGHPATLQFDAKEQRLSGSTGCNRFFGNYRSTGGADIAIGGVGSTRMACLAPDIGQQENEIFDELGKASRYGIAGDQLTITTNDGRQMLFAAVGPDTVASYRCDDGTVIGTVYSPLLDNLTLQLPNGQKQQLSPERKASGASFANDAYRFWSKGDGATLEDFAGSRRTQCQRQTASQ
jgi:heat shock protein HslJ